MEKIKQIGILLLFFSNFIFSYNVFNIDESVYELQLKSWEENGFSTNIKLSQKDSLTQELFINGYFPVYKPLITQVGKNFFSSYSILYPIVTYPLYKIFGDIGINLTSFIFFIFLVLLFYWYIHKLGYKSKSKIIIALFFALGWPIIFYSWYFGGQVAGMFFAMFGFAILDLQNRDKIKSTQLRLLFGGFLLSLAIMMRDEYYIFALSISLYFIWQFIINPKKCKCYIFFPIFGFLLGLIAFWGANFIFFNNILGNRGLATTVILDYLPNSLAKTSININSSFFDNPSVIKRLTNIWGLFKLYIFYQPYFLLVPFVILLTKKKKKLIGYILFFISYWITALVVLEGGGGISVGARSMMPTVPILFLFLLESKDVLAKQGFRILVFILLIFGVFTTWIVGFSFYSNLREENHIVYDYISKSKNKNVVVSSGYTAMIANDLQYKNKNIFSFKDDVKKLNSLIEIFYRNNINEFLYIEWNRNIIKEGLYHFKDFDVLASNKVILPSHQAFNIKLLKKPKK